MKLLNIKKSTKTKNEFSPKTGMLETRITYVKKYVLGVPIKTLKRYRETYNGEKRNYEDHTLFI